ncbi:MAG: SDR family NAD(P)-dependent oxidoreductase [Acidimicrobiaceae bacterium]|nr:SDR family NAD(P)-dependent oxidoreductase [Acidimicrobiaceae bacterium]
MGQLEGRTAIVTGAGEGIGRSVARAFASEGAHVLVAEIDERLGADAAAELGDACDFLPTDVGDRAAVEAMVAHADERWGSVDILVNNAWGGGEISRVERKTTAGMSRALAVGFYGPFWAMTAALPLMKANGWGRVINMCSLNGVNAHMGTVEYNSAKEALRAATRTAAREWAGWGITANVVCPAAKSASFHRVMGAHPDLLAAADASNPMGRIGDPDLDIAPVAVFLASEASRYVTGNTLFVDGGGHINGSAWKPDLDD